MQNLILFLFILISSFHFSNAAHANSLEKKLKQLTIDEKVLKQDINKLELKYKRSNSNTQRNKFENDIKNKQELLSKIQNTQLELLTNLNFKSVSSKGPEQSKNIVSEIQELIGPAIDGLKRLSARPRRIEKLKSEIEDLTKRIEDITLGLEDAHKIIKGSKDRSLKRILNEKLQRVISLKKELEFTLEEKKRYLNKELTSDKTFFESSTELAGLFFKTKGKHLLIALCSLLSIFWFFFSIRGKVFSSRLISNKLERWNKLLFLSYNVLAVILAVSSSLICLYILHDWILVTIFILVISALLWTSKQFLPQFVQEAKYILNLGTVREGEIISVDGIPWLVQNIGFQTILVNPLLSGGRRRMSISQLKEYSSRQIANQESWFPTEVNDWVELSSGIYGEVILQTPQQVKIKTLDGRILGVQTTEFLSLCPVNYSKGFSVETIFGLDYGIQKDVSISIPTQLEGHLNNKLSETKFFKLIEEVKVQFHSAGSSSLNIWIRLICEGTLAKDRRALERLVQRLCVEFCNEQKLTIPFDQLQVHTQ